MSTFFSFVLSNKVREKGRAAILRVGFFYIIIICMLSLMFIILFLSECLYMLYRLFYFYLYLLQTMPIGWIQTTLYQLILLIETAFYPTKHATIYILDRFLRAEHLYESCDILIFTYVVSPRIITDYLVHLRLSN